MPTIAVFTLPVNAFPLGGALREEPEMRIQLEPMVPSEEGPLPYFWAWDCADFGEFAQRVRELPEVKSLSEIDRVDDGVLYRTTWDREMSDLIAGLLQYDGALLGVSGTSEGWELELRFPNDARANEFYQFCIDNGVPLALQRIHDGAGAQTEAEYGLTRQQEETLVAAFRRGYFENPKRTSQKQLAESFSISQRAVSRRLQRGLSSLIDNTLVKADGDGEPEEV